MEGTILGFDGTQGAIRTTAGSRYRFSRLEWKSAGEPVVGARVDFLAEGEEAREVYLLSQPSVGLTEVLDTIEKSDKTMPTVVYACYLGAFLWGVTMLIGVVIAYLYRGGADGTIYRSHYDYQINIFWKSLLGFLVGFVLTIFAGLGLIIVIATYVWVIVKIIKGWRCLAEGQAAPLS